MATHGGTTVFALSSSHTRPHQQLHPLEELNDVSAISGTWSLHQDQVVDQVEDAVSMAIHVDLQREALIAYQNSYQNSYQNTDHAADHAIELCFSCPIRGRHRHRKYE